jgi:hypothetical protein
MEDQVVRLQAWRANHPDVEIRPPDYSRGGYLWSAHRNGLVLACDRELKALLDRCDWLAQGKA